jgi:hypothetical protein
MIKHIVFLIILFFPLLSSSLLMAGNVDMVENRVDELDKLNMEAVDQIAGKPGKGIINLKVRAIPGKDGYKFVPIEKEPAQSGPDNVLSDSGEDRFFTFRDGIARLTNKKPAITPYKNLSNEGEYITFKDAVIRLSRSRK